MTDAIMTLGPDGEAPESGSDSEACRRLFEEVAMPLVDLRDTSLQALDESNATAGDMQSQLLLAYRGSETSRAVYSQSALTTNKLGLNKFLQAMLPWPIFFGVVCSLELPTIVVGFHYSGLTYLAVMAAFFLGIASISSLMILSGIKMLRGCKFSKSLLEPDHIAISPQGINLQWSSTIFSFMGLVLPWKRIALVYIEEHRSGDEKHEVLCIRDNLGKALRLDCSAFASDVLIKALQKRAPWAVKEPPMVLALQPAQNMRWRYLLSWFGSIMRSDLRSDLASVGQGDESSLVARIRRTSVYREEANNHIRQIWSNYIMFLRQRFRDTPRKGQEQFIMRMCQTLTIGAFILGTSLFYPFLPPMIRVVLLPGVLVLSWWLGTRVVARKAVSMFEQEMQPRERLSQKGFALISNPELKQGKYRILKSMDNTSGKYYLAEVTQSGRSETGPVTLRGVLGFDQVAHAGAALVKVQQFILPAEQDPYQLYMMLDHFEREVRRLSRVNSNNISRWLDVFLEDMSLYVVTEYDAGKTLRQCVDESGPFSELKVREFALEMCEILSHLHKLDPAYIHKGFTPDALILSENQFVKLNQFVIGTQLLPSRLSSPGLDRRYLPIEQLHNHECPQCDIYAFGASLYFLLTGRDPKPFVASNALLDGASVSERFSAIIARATEPSPRNRYESVDDIKTDILDLANSETSLLLL